MSYDIQCNNKKCPIKVRCDRYQAAPGPKQKYQKFKFTVTKPNERRLDQRLVYGCEHFYSIIAVELDEEIAQEGVKIDADEVFLEY